MFEFLKKRKRRKILLDNQEHIKFVKNILLYLDKDSKIALLKELDSKYLKDEAKYIGYDIENEFNFVLDSHFVLWYFLHKDDILIQDMTVSSAIDNAINNIYKENKL